ncbi:hypothetical protein [Streptomyces hokutonensis]|uniref:hypothetical protein n=1 Tax=Streptomyces hokutonensis TaxID=1306990 RepID=UPI00035CB701|nr:hypothetical protein [Streptomyces hokutonensis]
MAGLDLFARVIRIALVGGGLQFRVDLLKTRFAGRPPRHLHVQLIGKVLAGEFAIGVRHSLGCGRDGLVRACRLRT